MIVVAVALHWLAAGFADGVSQCFGGLFFRRCHSCHMKNLFPHDRAVQIIHSIAQRHLSKRKSSAHPIGREMIEVIEIDPADREIAQLIKAVACGIWERAVSLPARRQKG